MGGAWAAASVLKRVGAPAAARHMAWLLGITALLALPVLWSLVPALRLPILPAEAATGAAAVASLPVAEPPAALTGSASPELSEYGGWSLVLLVAYAIGAVALLLRLVVGRRLLARLWDDAGAVQDAAWEKLLSQLSFEMRLSRRVELRIARGSIMPMTWGTLAPKLLLPAEASAWPPERRRLVLLHELAHVARYDSLSRSAASLACAFYWLHPGVWFAARQMRLEQEHAADDRVLISGGSPQAYAHSLLHLARGMAERLQPDLAATMAGACQLERRLVSITSPARRDRPSTLFLSSSASIATLATLIAAAGVPVSPSSTLLHAVPPRLAGITSPVGKRLDSARAEDAAASEGRAEAVSVTQERPARESTGALESEPEARASAVGRTAETGPDQRQETLRGKDRAPAPAYAQQLPDYGWELPRRDSNVQIGALTPPSSPTGLNLPTPISSASKERTGRPKWTQIIPQLVPANTPTSPRPTPSQGTLMLSWSVDVGPR
jgi:beta-lactamase regulating signal transducer with metallopeptidase domain